MCATGAGVPSYIYIYIYVYDWRRCKVTHTRTHTHTHTTGAGVQSYIHTYKQTNKHTHIHIYVFNRRRCTVIHLRQSHMRTHAHARTCAHKRAHARSCVAQILCSEIQPVSRISVSAALATGNERQNTPRRTCQGSRLLHTNRRLLYIYSSWVCHKSTAKQPPASGVNLQLPTTVRFEIAGNCT
jgi:hypothetical protein